MNADPNYGSAWFHCRMHPNEISSSIIKNGKIIIFHELVDTHQIYCRALLHYVIRCFNSKYNSLSGQDISAIYDDTDRQNMAQGGKEHDVSISTVDKIKSFNQREIELLQDFDIAKSQLGNWPIIGFDNEISESSIDYSGNNIIPFIEVNDGELFSFADFITGIVGMNRSIFNRYSSDEVRRKNIFGSDQIIS
jgi:hypothetical protein